MAASSPTRPDQGSDRPSRSHDRETTVNDLTTRWGGHKVLQKSLHEEGFLAVPIAFLKHLGELGEFGLTPTEALFVLQIMSYKWDESAPFPSYKTLAKRMGVSEVYARKLARSLEEKHLLKRVERVGTTNRFDLHPLFDSLADRLLQEAASQ